MFNTTIIPTATLPSTHTRPLGSNGDRSGIASVMFGIDGHWHVPLIARDGGARMVQIGAVDPRFPHFVAVGDAIRVDDFVYRIVEGGVLEQIGVAEF